MSNIKIILICIFILLYTNSNGQKTTSRLTIESGATVNFYFNTLDDYINGKTFNNWTKVTVDYDTTGGSATTDHWRLGIKALTPEIEGTGVNFLPLDVIDIEVTHNNPDPPAVSPINLTDFDQYIITNGRVGITTVFITYHCGKNIVAPFFNLLGSKPDYYFVEIQLTLEPN